MVCASGGRRIVTTVSLSEQFGHKIKTAQELRAIIGDRPRENSVVMCHGVFDVVHPGHVRHLLYAKSLGSILIASITADRHIVKGVYRPHIPQELRAANLAAFEMVDYVLIDTHAEPIENLKILEPDLFAKGYEYQSGAVNPKTSEEQRVIESYGGELIFTPGDIVYSSSRLIELDPPQIKSEKLINLMEQAGIEFDTLRQTLLGMKQKKLHVVGDTIVDSLTHCALIGGQTKTPTLSVLYQDRADYVGGAAIVAKHLKASGAEVEFSTVLGDDDLKDMVLADLEAAGVSTRPVIDSTRPTTNKNAVVVGGYRLLKIDTLDNRSITNGVLKHLVDGVASNKSDAILFSDFRHGLFNKRTIPALVEAIPEGTYRVADSQVASRWGNITEFTDFDLITPNEREARFALADQDSGVRPLASRLYDAAACKTLILKLGDRGVLTCVSDDHEALDSFFSIDSFVDNLVDPVGAGDALLAYSTLAMLVSGSPIQATILGSIAAALECEQDGNIPISPADLLDRLSLVERQVTYS